MGYICLWYIADHRRFRSHKTFFFRRRSGRTADLPAKLNSSQLRRLAGGKGLRWLLLPTAYVLICRNSIPTSTGGCVVDSSAAYENQAFATATATGDFNWQPSSLRADVRTARFTLSTKREYIFFLSYSNYLPFLNYFVFERCNMELKL